MFAAGNYTARIVRQGIAQSSQKGTPYVWFDVQITKDGQGNATSGERQVAIWLTESAMEVAEKQLKAIGFDVQQYGVEQLDPDHQQYFDMTGVEMPVYCKHETFTKRDGSMGTKDKFSISTNSGPATKPLEAGKRNDIKKFTAMLRKGAPAKTPAARPAAVPANRPAPTRQTVPANNTTFADEETI